MILPLAAYTKQLPHSPQMHKHITVLYGKVTADLSKMLSSSMYRDQLAAMSNLSAHMLEQQRFEEFQSGAANQATEGSTLFHLATLFTSGFTSFNAFLQLFTSIIEAKQTKKIGNLVQSLVDFWFFNKLFNISFQKITGVNLGAHAEGMVEKMIAEVFRKAQIADLLQNDNALAKSCLSGFYQSYAHIKFEQGGKQISLFESNDFIYFAKNLFVEDNGRVINPKSSAHPKLTPEHINGQADKKLSGPLKTAVKKLVTELETDHSHRPYAMTPFFFFSVALRSGKVSTSQELFERINLKDE